MAKVVVTKNVETVSDVLIESVKNELDLKIDLLAAELVGLPVPPVAEPVPVLSDRAVKLRADLAHLNNAMGRLGLKDGTKTAKIFMTGFLGGMELTGVEIDPVFWICAVRGFEFKELERLIMQVK